MDWIQSINTIYNSDEYTVTEKYYIFSQINSILFSEYKGPRENIDIHLFNLYAKIVDECIEKLDFNFNFINSRNNNFVLIITSQFLSPHHAPTAVVLDIARFLVSQGKQILIVNSAECLGGLTPDLLEKNIPFPLDKARLANYIPEYCNLDNYEYQNRQYPFFQFDNNMPNIDAIRMFLSTVNKLKPGFIINVGGNSLLADACSKLVPTLCYSLGNSICYSHANAQYIGRLPQHTDINLLSILKRDISCIIPGNYIYNILDNGEKESRSDFNIDENVFLLAIVGNRLASELDEDFLSMLDYTVSPQINVLFVGDYPEHNTIFSKYANLSKYSYFRGYTNDLLATLSMCNLYVNPRRSGGGTSSVMALIKGCPVLTTDYGDIATAVGPNFTVESMQDYPLYIKKYCEDKDFYAQMSQRAYLRASELTDADNMYASLLSYFYKMIEIL